jgi:hypothetical protein
MLPKTLLAYIQPQTKKNNFFLKKQKNSRCINAQLVTALLDPINNATIERANKKNRTEQNKQTNATRRIPKRSNLRITTTAMHNYLL